MITITCEDCMGMMARYADKYFDLAIVDPPYGIGKDWKKRHWKSRHNRPKFVETSYKNDTVPAPEYFEELFRVSRDVIIFGYNYFSDILGPTNYLIVWNKVCSEKPSVLYSQAEIAYTTIHKPVQVFSVQWDGCKMGKETHVRKIHPHQKPIELYVKILLKYATPGMKILDTHMGSGSSIIACQGLGFDIWASEIDPVYFSAAERRIKTYTSQADLFPATESISPALFEEAVL